MAIYIAEPCFNHVLNGNLQHTIRCFQFNMCYYAWFLYLVSFKKYLILIFSYWIYFMYVIDALVVGVFEINLAALHIENIHSYGEYWKIEKYNESPDIWVQYMLRGIQQFKNKIKLRLKTINNYCWRCVKEYILAI